MRGCCSRSRGSRGCSRRGSADLDAEDELAFQLAAVGIAGWERQYRYVPGRRFRADFAFPALRLLVEVQGGIYPDREGRRRAHGSVTGVKRDNERLNQATLHGWQVLRFIPDEVRDGSALAFIEQVLAAR